MLSVLPTNKQDILFVQILQFTLLSEWQSPHYNTLFNNLVWPFCVRDPDLSYPHYLPLPTECLFVTFGITLRLFRPVFDVVLILINTTFSLVLFIYFLYNLFNIASCIIISDNSSCVFGSNATILNIDKNVDTSTKLTKQERYLFMTEVDTNCGTLSFEWKVSNVTSPPFTVGKAHSITVGLDSEWSNITFLNLGILFGWVYCSFPRLLFSWLRFHQSVAFTAGCTYCRRSRSLQET